MAWRTHLAERLARSSRIFLLGLMVACGIEVVVDWNQTLFEMNVLRDQIHQKGRNYAGLLEKVTVEPMLKGDVVTLDLLSAGIIDDEDAVFVRVTDENGRVVFDRLDPIYEQSFEKRGKGTFRSHYAHWLDRDMRGVIEDPVGFKQRLANSRYRDFPQLWTDTTARVLGLFIKPQALPPSRAEIVYQDRLRDENHHRDETTAWAIAPLTSQGKKVGAVLVAFDMTRINQAVHTKYLKGLGMIAFFVGLSLVQNIIGRRDKLRLLDLEVRHADAKRALREALPRGKVAVSGLQAYGALEQAKGAVDGMVFDAAAREGALEILVIDPDGYGIDAAAIGLHMLRTFRARKRSILPAADLADTAGAEPSLYEAIAEFGAATNDIPLTSPIGILLLHVRPSGDFTAVLGAFASLQLLQGTAAQALPLSPVLDSSAKEAAVPAGIVGPLYRCTGTIPAGATLLVACAGRGTKEARLDSEALARYLLRSPTAAAPNIEDAAIWARGKNAALSENDIAVVVVHRA